MKGATEDANSPPEGEQVFWQHCALCFERENISNDLMINGQRADNRRIPFHNSTFAVICSCCGQEKQLELLMADLCFCMQKYDFAH